MHIQLTGFASGSQHMKLIDTHFPKKYEEVYLKFMVLSAKQKTEPVTI